MDIIILISGALAIDLLLGEPPLPVHPVVWMGKLISLWSKAGTRWRPVLQFIYGMVMALIITGLFAVSTYYILFGVRHLSYAAYLIVGVILFKTTFSVRELWRTAREIKNLLQAGKLDKARFQLRGLCKRDARNMPEPLVVSATVESVAENACDSFVAPLFYFLLFGVPGAMAYRVINTMDSMIGYHGKFEYVGKFAARLDDAANIVPSRLTALMIVLAAFILQKNARKSWQVMNTDNALTDSPNAGWPMAAAAGALDVRLEKEGYYQLGAAGNRLVPQTIDSAFWLVGTAALIWTILCLITGAIFFGITS